MKIKEYILIFLLAGWGSIAFSQNDSVEYHRQLGYEAKLEGNFNKAISFYSLVLKEQNDDYDAKLAIARLYYTIEDYSTSIHYFNNILSNDSTDVEAAIGLGDNYLLIDSLDKSIEYYSNGIALLPTYVPLYLKLAVAYSWQGSLDKAIKTYEKILTIDDTYAEAWQGIGKMYYWKDKPKTALVYYLKAIELDPTEQSTNKEYEQIKQQLKLVASGTLKILNETEESYTINAIVQQYSLKKRVNDNFNISMNFLLDYSDRDYTHTKKGDTIRWYDNTWIKAGWITEHHKIYAYGGYTVSDSKFSAYGLNWKWNFSFGSFKFINSMVAGYDYFYYWNKVGQYLVSDNLDINYNNFGLNLGYRYGLVDKAFVTDVRNDNYFESTNPYTSFTTSLTYKIFSKPKITLAANYSYLNYTYKSPQYYSPYGRSLFGPSVNFYYPVKNFYFYGDMGYNFGSEYYYDIKKSEVKKIELNANNWSANAEFGYNYNSFSVSLSASRFYNDYYSNYFAALTLKYIF